MAVPIGETNDEVQGRLAVAMLDAGNIQAQDFLSTQSAGQSKFIWLANCINNVLSQYHVDLDDTLADAELKCFG